MQTKEIIPASYDWLHYGSELASSCFIPSSRVRGMTALNTKEFSSKLQVPTLRIPVNSIRSMGKSLKPLQLLRPGLKPIADLPTTDCCVKTHKLVLLDPNRWGFSGIWAIYYIQRRRFKTVTLKTFLWTKILHLLYNRVSMYFSEFSPI